MPLVVDSRTQHVQVPSHESLNLKNFTVQVWCKAKTWSDEPGYQREAGWPVILTKSMTWCDGFGMYGCPPNEIRCYVNKWDKQYVTARVDIGKWTCLTVTFKASESGSTLTIYLDGKEVDSTPNLPPVRRNDAPVNIGAALWGEVWYAWNGEIGPVTIWNEALSAVQVSAAVAGRDPSARKVLHLKLDETEGKDAVDSSPSGNTAGYRNSMSSVGREALPPSTSQPSDHPWNKKPAGGVWPGIAGASLVVAVAAAFWLRRRA
mmetsp:Transcript_63780/g.152105  ORF Transcript_63780/g.152105 Transcript_63780/m.152105 type:complete len:262 (-) Transcript_63780:45-830(-)|eukprot:CAMPEP_0180150484 /NCGR_PEP_ID=MMETSP0986-20121125/21477_1 /TAXON_ID=697907 /ORGANISM="non described non described, Strain CCMP2293" /LENGTH=261 /DNA_ID=CAMNT_0022097429 /DNA_START=41 /DNA_END=826 /DNA_ORIENTATION=+